MDNISYVIILGVITLIIIMQFLVSDETISESFYGGFYYPYDYPYYYPYFYSGCNENVFGDVNCGPTAYPF